MLAVERRRVIAEALRSRGVVSVVEMAEQLGTTEITVRRDLRAMAKDGLVMRARGGAILPAPIGHDPSYSEKARQAATEKASIARAAVEMIRPGDSILLGPGTTTQALAKLLVDFPELTVVTNSLLVAQALMRPSRGEVILTGGTLRRAIHAAVGPSSRVDHLHVPPGAWRGSRARTERSGTGATCSLTSRARALSCARTPGHQT